MGNAAYGGYNGGCFSVAAWVLVLFILLVIIISTFVY